MLGAVAIVLAAGSGERLGSSIPKAFVPLAGRPLLVHAVEAALSSSAVSSAVLAVPEDRLEEARAVVGSDVVVVAGGDTRQASVRAALHAVPGDVARIVCHDAARAIAPASLFDTVVGMLDGWDGVVPAIPVADTVKRVDGDTVVATEDRDALVLVQTPQAFISSALRAAHELAERDGAPVTDDAAALERAGYRVRVVPGDARAFKITGPDDLARAEALLAEVRRG